MNSIISGLGSVAFHMLIALLPLVLLVPMVSILFHPPRQLLYNVLKGLLLTYLGITLLMHGIHIALLPLGELLGEALGSQDNRWIAIPIGVLLGFVATMAEPAVRVLCRQVESASSGYIKSHLLLYSLGVGVSLFVGIGIARIVYALPFKPLIYSGYLILLVLMRFSDPTFTAIAFDAGGVATGPMIVTFVMAMGVGLARVIEGRDPIMDGFGLVALVALAPILSIMLLGQIYKVKSKAGKEDAA